MSCGQNLENLRLSGMNLDLLMSLSVLGKRLFGRERQRRTSGAKAPGIFGAVAARLEVVPFPPQLRKTFSAMDADISRKEVYPWECDLLESWGWRENRGKIFGNK